MDSEKEGTEQSTADEGTSTQRIAGRLAAKPKREGPTPEQIARDEPLPKTADELHEFAGRMHWQGVLYAHKDETTSYYFFMAERVARAQAVGPLYSTQPTDTRAR